MDFTVDDIVYLSPINNSSYIKYGVKLTVNNKTLKSIDMGSLWEYKILIDGKSENTVQDLFSFTPVIPDAVEDQKSITYTVPFKALSDWEEGTFSYAYDTENVFFSFEKKEFQLR